MPWVEAEKESLVATFRSTDPDSATLCQGWTVRHLLAHLVQRDQDIVGLIGDRLNRRAPGHEKYLSRLVDGARSPVGYEALLSRFLQGPPRWSATRWAAEPLSFLEFVIHHEDVRRGGPVPREPRALPAEETSAIWRRISRLAWLTYRRAPAGVALAVPDGSRLVAKKGAGVVLTGGPVELLLYLSGRREAAHVDLSGDSEAVAEFLAWVPSSRGM